MRCTVEADASEFVFTSGQQTQGASRNTLLKLSAQVDGWREAQTYEAIRQLARDDFFAPAKYIMPKPLARRCPTACA
ncbi:MAG: hypothetical protein HC853_03835 [Anaerolineae bacterium]|nr:hypothetical protein [Anaerolineae bacterium]